MSNNALTTGASFSVRPVLAPREQVESQLRAAMMDGSIRAGQRLPSEHSLATSFNVSRATVREALRSLVESGLLSKGTGITSGLYVESVDHVAFSRVLSERLKSILSVGSVTAAEVSTCRDLLEVPSARLAAEKRTEEHLQALHGIIDMEREITYEDPRIPELNAGLHIEIANATGNRVLAAFVAALHRTTQPLAFLHIDKELGRIAVSHHINLYRAIKTQDIEEAGEAMRSHLDYLRSRAEEA
jgi:GntR family transcriptional repressor for pyruvate dehydrogenase complex